MKVKTTLMGGLGNNLFQICCLLGYSLRNKIDYCVPIVIHNPHYEGQEVFYSNKLNYCTSQKGVMCVYKEPFFNYKEVPKQTCDNYKLYGYWQSEKYFSGYREEILKILDIPYEFKKGYVAIHWRLGDYLKLPDCHPVVTVDYIHNAIKYFIDKGYKNFIVFSDDLEYCFNNIDSTLDCTIGFSQGRTDVEDLSLASSCEHSVGSNSSFSWWIYWLNRNENKIGVFPKKDKWFGTSLPHNVDDMYMPEWILI